MSVMIFNHGGGGASSLSVKAYSAVGSLPSSASAGDIALITALSVGEAYAGADAPAPPTTGTVWVWTGSKSLQAIPLTGTITLFPRAVYRWSGSAWVLLRSYVYSGTAWVEITLSMYDNGVFILEPSAELILGATLTLQATRIYAQSTAGRGEVSQLRVYFANSIDLTNISTVKIIIDWATSGASSSKVLKLEIGSNKTGTVVAYAQTSATGMNITLSANVAALSGLYYIGIFAYAPPNSDSDYPSNTIYIQKAYMEK